jgi:hypothetical protein
MRRPNPQNVTPPVPIRIPNLIGRYTNLGAQGAPQTEEVLNAGTATALYGAQSLAFGSVLNVPKPTVVNRNQFLDMNAYTPDGPDSADGFSKLGTPVFSKIILGLDGQENRYTDSQGREGQYTTVELDCALVDIEFNKNIVKTEIQGLNQSIKEFISNSDRNITITGRFDSTPGIAPIDFIINLNNLFSAPIPIPVKNYYLNNNNIYYIVIMPGSRIWQSEGGYSYQEFTIEAVSDIPMTEMLP